MAHPAGRAGRASHRGARPPSDVADRAGPRAPAALGSGASRGPRPASRPRPACATCMAASPLAAIYTPPPATASLHIDHTLQARGRRERGIASRQGKPTPQRELAERARPFG
ncbi:hypothetical protein ABZP36_015899 [Zizania latifolia]